MADGEFDIDAMIQRFRDRAQAVKKRNLPPVAGEEREQFLQQAQLDFQDFAIIGDASASLDDGILTLRVDLRPPDDRDDADD
jgi:hypothetical protein